MIYNRKCVIIDVSQSDPPFYPQLGKKLTFPSFIGDMVVTCEKNKDNLYTYSLHAGHRIVEIARYHFNAWPNHGMVDVDILEQLTEMACKETHPVWVHGSDESGPAGTVIAASMLKRQIQGGAITAMDLESKLIALIVTLRAQQSVDIVPNIGHFSLLCEYGKRLLAEKPSNHYTAATPKE